uniref:WRKY domain-containing protein n=1 Tax=Lotus japonicus TaxID=34305 RepID=I3SNQ6_LOTJA|nr:unknown [Lotus japonicus]
MEPTTCSVVDTSLNLNVAPSWDTVVDVSVLVEELERLNSENKRLTETLNHICDNYLTMQKHLAQLNSNSPDDFEKEAGIPSRKRKAENLFVYGSSGYTECSTITEEENTIFKRPSTSPKVSKVLVRTEASDTSLVSSILFTIYICVAFGLMSKVSQVNCKY